MRAAYDPSLERRDGLLERRAEPTVLPRRRRADAAWIVAVVAITLAYAIVRYVVLGTTPWSQLPAFLLNKAVAWSAVILIGVAVASRSRETRRSTGLAGAAFSVLHLLLTVPLVSPTYFPKLFEAGAYTWSALGQLALLTGALAIIGLAVVAWSSSRAPGSPPWIRRVPAAVVVLAALHCVALGTTGGWEPGSRAAWDPQTWPAGLPSISLLAFASAAAALALKWSRRPHW